MALQTIDPLHGKQNTTAISQRPAITKQPAVKAALQQWERDAIRRG
jgi:hypothetical protein